VKTPEFKGGFSLQNHLPVFFGRHSFKMLDELGEIGGIKSKRVGNI
jgi:hypothetical protein